MPQRVTPAQIALWARQRGLDPQAVLAVAAQEGLGGGIGDQGTSFGPWQLHQGGAYPSSAPQDPQAANAWAWSPAGVQYALGGIQRVAAGTKGQQAVRQIVSRFERPADPQGEIARALAGLGGAVQTPHRAAPPDWTGVIGVPDKIIGTPYSGTHTLGNWESDNAVDLAAPVGTPIYAFQSGVIGPQFGSLGSGGRFAGLRLHVRSKGNEAYYAHLSKFAPGIQPGAQVTRGQLLGYSGEANGVGHLHFGVESGDPRNFIGPGGAAAAPTADANTRQTLSARTPAAPAAPRALPAAVKQALAILRS